MKRQTLLRRLLIAGGVLVVLVLVVVGPILLKNLNKTTNDPVALATVAKRSFPVVASATGNLENAGLENANFVTSGQVSAIYVSVGSKVSIRQPLAKLDDTTERAKLNAAQAAYNSARAQLAQAEAGGSSAQILSAQTAVANAYVQLVTAQQAETATTLVAPEAGSVLAVNGSVGDAVSAAGQGTTVPTVGAPVANGFIVIGNPSSFVMWPPFSQTEEVQLAVGQPAAVTVSALPGLLFPATVTVVQGSATQVTGVPEYLAEITLTRTDPRLRNGQTATVDVTVTTANNVLSVPTAALFTGSNGALQVDVWSQGAAYATTVTIGLVGNTYTQITSGLQQGEQVVLSPTGPGLSSSPVPSPT
jgi:membrane fusion protein, macrolide-specific efflux system